MTVRTYMRILRILMGLLVGLVLGADAQMALGYMAKRQYLAAAGTMASSVWLVAAIWGVRCIVVEWRKISVIKQRFGELAEAFRQCGARHTAAMAADDSRRIYAATLLMHRSAIRFVDEEPVLPLPSEEEVIDQLYGAAHERPVSGEPN